MTKPIILLDMDAVLFDFHNGLRDLVIEDAYINGYETQIPFEFETWSLFTGHKETDKAISNVLNQQRFFADLEPMEGAVEAVESLRESATVFFLFNSIPHEPSLCRGQGTQPEQGVRCRLLEESYSHVGQDCGTR